MVDGEIFRLPDEPISRTQFIEEMKMAVDRSGDKAVFGYRTLEDAQIAHSENIDNRYDRSVAMVLRVLGGILAIDDFSSPITRRGGTSSTPMYELEKPLRWPDGLFKKMVGLVWVIDKPISPLDSIVRNV